jgi:GT2 family glycosyltransferase
VNRQDEQLHKQLEDLQQLLKEGGPAVSRQELLAMASLIAEALKRSDTDHNTLLRHDRDLEIRLQAIENSRFFHVLRLPGRFLLDWKGRFGQLLLRSPLHPLYMKLVRPEAAAERYRLWMELERPVVARVLQRRPLISIILPVQNPRQDWLQAAVESVRKQTYGDWQLCVCDDGSSGTWVQEYFCALAGSDRRIVFTRCPKQLGISGASNRAGESAEGEYVGFLDQDDVLAPEALYCFAEALQEKPADLLYSDEDYMTSDGHRVQPIFKPAFSPDLLRCCMYMGHFLVVRKERLQEIGWLRSSYDGSQDYDLALRVTERSRSVRHIPRVLYHWRRHPDSTAFRASAKPFTDEAGLRALSESVQRTDGRAVVVPGSTPNTYRVRWPVPASLKASIVICSRNPRLLARCLKSIRRTTSYANFELVVVQHRIGNTAEMDRLLRGLGCLRIPYAGPFHFAVMNNLAAKRAGGEALVFLNDDVEPLAPEWLGELLAHANRPEVGPVGAKLLYPSGAIQHAGMAVGIMQGAGHLHRDTFGAEHWNWLPFTRNVSAVTGACLAVRKTVFEELGGFDESFAINYNDVDFCLRARQAGYEVIIEPAAVLRHYECQTRKPGVSIEERDLFHQRWEAWLERGDPFYSPWLNRSGEDAGLALEHNCEVRPR